MTLTTSPSLLKRAGAGDQQAWQLVVQLYGPLVYAWARRTGLTPPDAADATQETFVALSTRLVSFDPDHAGATFRGWLWTITRNKSADLARQRSPDASPRGGSTNVAKLNAINAEPDSIAEPSPASVADEASEQREVVRRALALLRQSFEPTTWQAFWRTVVDGVSPDEVAQELNLSRWAVYKARSRVLHRLRAELSGLEKLE
jgi:RNA polymerase sigma-70 factor (ECF subfamily)